MPTPRMATDGDRPEIIRLRRIMLQDIDDLSTVDDSWETLPLRPVDDGLTRPRPLLSWQLLTILNR